MRTPKLDVMSISPCRGPREVDAIDLLLERARIGREPVGDERPAGRGLDVLAGVDADLGEHGAHPARLCVVGLFEGRERIDLTAFHGIERRLDTRHHRLERRALDRRHARQHEAAGVGARVRWRAGGRWHRDRRGLGRRRLAARRANRTGGWVGDRAERCCALLELRLPVHDLLDLLLELLLFEHVAARHPVDLGAHLGDAVLIGRLHLHPGEHVVLEGEIGGGRHAPPRHDHEGADHGPECHRADADLAAGMAEHEGTALLRLGGRGLGGFSLGGLRAVPLAGMLGAVARIGMLCAVVGLSGAALVTGVPAIHANVIGGGMGPR
jgi:hypothetical protein